MCDTGCVIPALPQDIFHLPVKNRWTDSRLAQDSVISKTATQGKTLNCIWAEHWQVQQRPARAREGSQGGWCQDMEEEQLGGSQGGTLHRSGCPSAEGRLRQESGDWARLGG